MGWVGINRGFTVLQFTNILRTREPDRMSILHYRSNTEQTKFVFGYVQIVMHHLISSLLSFVLVCSFGKYLLVALFDPLQLGIIYLADFVTLSSFDHRQRIM